MSILHSAKIAAGLFLGMTILAPAIASPYLPSKDNQVLENLPSRNDSAQRELNNLRTQLIATPNNLALATDLAKRYINTGRNNADPRYLGYAQAALSPWWTMENPPIDVLVLRASLLQSTHQFEKSLTDLTSILKTDQNNVQAWLMHATIMQVTGEYQQAKNSCAKLYRLVPTLIFKTCLYNVANLNGDAKKSYTALSAELKNNTTATPDIQIWVSTLLAEMAQRLDDTTAAELHFKKALSLTVADSYLFGAYADFLLDQGRNNEVIALLKDKTRADGLLLRYALALKEKGDIDATAQIDTLRVRFDSAMLRGDTVHQREQARFELHLMKNSTRALKLAQENWQIQKEPADLRILLEAALAAKEKAAAQPALAWLKKVDLQDSAVTRLTKSLETL